MSEGAQDGAFRAALTRASVSSLEPLFADVPSPALGRTRPLLTLGGQPSGRHCYLCIVREGVSQAQIGPNQPKGRQMAQKPVERHQRDLLLDTVWGIDAEVGVRLNGSGSPNTGPLLPRLHTYCTRIAHALHIARGVGAIGGVWNPLFQARYDSFWHTDCTEVVVVTRYWCNRERTQTSPSGADPTYQRAARVWPK